MTLILINVIVINFCIFGLTCHFRGFIIRFELSNLIDTILHEMYQHYELRLFVLLVILLHSLKYLFTMSKLDRDCDAKLNTMKI